MGKTVTTYLITGDPKGTRYAFIKNKICQMFVIPRSDLEYLNQQEMLHKPAFYILLGEDDSLKPKAYIGETENFKERVKDHDVKKTFWQRALVFVSKDADMTKADVQYLEHLAISAAKKANTYVLNENKQTPKAQIYLNISEMRWMSSLRIFNSLLRSLDVIYLNFLNPKQTSSFIRKDEGAMLKASIAQRVSR